MQHIQQALLYKTLRCAPSPLLNRKKEASFALKENLLVQLANGESIVVSFICNSKNRAAKDQLLPIAACIRGSKPYYSLDIDPQAIVDDVKQHKILQKAEVEEKLSLENDLFTVSATKRLEPKKLKVIKSEQLFFEQWSHIQISKILNKVFRRLEKVREQDQEYYKEDDDKYQKLQEIYKTYLQKEILKYYIKQKLYLPRYK